jgi:hypothetical protein
LVKPPFSLLYPPLKKSSTRRTERLGIQAGKRGHLTLSPPVLAAGRVLSVRFSFSGGEFLVSGVSGRPNLLLTCPGKIFVSSFAAVPLSVWLVEEPKGGEKTIEKGKVLSKIH